MILVGNRKVVWEGRAGNRSPYPDLTTAGDNLECHAIANTWVDRGRWSIWIPEESANPLSFGHWQWIEAESTFVLKAQGWFLT
jgi:hypothetical protein